jgi:hypothetical protein
LRALRVAFAGTLLCSGMATALTYGQGHEWHAAPTSRPCRVCCSRGWPRCPQHSGFLTHVRACSAVWTSTTGPSTALQQRYQGRLWLLKNSTCALCTHLVCQACKVAKARQTALGEALPLDRVYSTPSCRHAAVNAPPLTPPALAPRPQGLAPLSGAQSGSGDSDIVGLGVRAASGKWHSPHSCAMGNRLPQHTYACIHVVCLCSAVHPLRAGLR